MLLCPTPPYWKSQFLFEKDLDQNCLPLCNEQAIKITSNRLPVGVGADADAALVGRPRLPPEAVGLGVLVTVGVGDRKDVPEVKVLIQNSLS